MGFDGNDIDKMFAEAAGAAEDTGEKGMGMYSDDPKETKEPAKADVKEPVAVTKPEVKTETKPEVKTKQDPVKQEPVKKVEPAKKPEPAKKAEKEEAPKPVESKPVVQDRQAGGILNSSKGITEEAIGRILDMNETFAKFDDTQKDFVSGYFQLEEGNKNVSTVVYRALIASKRDLDALSQIVVAKGHSAAERAFFLMGLENYNIEDIYEQVELLTGDLGEVGQVTDGNKLKVCRKVEGVIAEMPKDVFTYIEKLQQFTDKALPK